MINPRAETAKVHEAQAGPSSDAQPCLNCMQTLMAWANHLGFHEDAMKQLVQDNPVEPDKTWTIIGKGGVELLCVHHTCPRCSKSWTAYRRT